MLGRKYIVLAKVESIYGTDPVPTTSADALYVEDLEVGPEIDMLERSSLGVALEHQPELTGKKRMKASFTAELKGSGSAGVAPKGLGALLKACGMVEWIVTSTSITYAPSKSPSSSCTLYVYKDGKRYVLTGSVGTVDLEGKAGEIAKLKFTMSALYATPTDVALPSSITTDSTVPVTLKNLTATFDSYAAVIRSFGLKLNSAVTERADMTATHGIKGFQVTDINPEGEVLLEMTLLATKNWYTKLEANTEQTLSVVIGGTAGNICTITATHAHLRNVEDTVEDDILCHNLPFQCAGSAGNDSFQIAFT